MTHLSPYLSYSLAAMASAWLLLRIYRRLQLSFAKHPSLAGHPRSARRIARLLPAYRLQLPALVAADGAPPTVQATRSTGLERLAAEFERRYPQGRALAAELAEGLPDLDFTSRYRVPFQFSEAVRKQLAGSAFMSRSDGVLLTDVDGNQAYDLAGSYGVNLFGYDFYKGCIERANARVAALGPVLGSYHPLILDNVRRLQAISGHTQVSFHMSGTEAVMQAVRLARYHTGRSRLVRFCGAYHGWWGEVQPGVGNPVPADRTLTLRDMDARSLQILRTRRDIACVLVNPLQALHPNRNAPGDSALLLARAQTGASRERYAAWLTQLRQVCSERGIVLIFDEVFVGFRLARGGAQAYYGVQADLVTYGKTLGGGYPVGVVCGPASLMRRYKPERPADICFARGTFNAHPYVMAAMNEFLQALDRAEIAALYEGLDERWDRHAAALNERLLEAELPIQVAHLSSIWSLNYAQPSRFHWLLQYYLRAEGLQLSWVGTGRFIFSLNYSDTDMTEVSDRIVRAALRMRADGWWWRDPQSPPSALRRRLLGEFWRAWRLHRD
jgi:glutamate-1-semialdehyde 2,1-aminomutase